MPNFEIIPAVDILNGKCVRLTRGDYKTEKVYSEDPLQVAIGWTKFGAKRLHIVDLDGAKSGEPKNIKLIKKIAARVQVPIEVGGGIRKMETIDDLILSGIDRVILGTSSINEPDLIKKACAKQGEKIAVSIDVKEGKPAVKGWTEVSEKDVVELAKELIGLGVKRFIYTDIMRDGTLTGPNIEGVKTFAKAIIIPVIASGGVSSKEDVEHLKGLSKYGVEGCIIGKALYEGKIKLEEVL